MHFVAVDIGNTRLKLGLFDGAAVAPGGTLPRPARTLSVPVDRLDDITAWLAPHSVADIVWYVGSVQRAFTTELLDWLRRGPSAPRLTLLCAGDLPLKVELPRPDMAGIDRLLAAVGVNAVREPARPAVIVDLGTAVTVDLVSADGAFQGGAILPGIAMSARALHEFTDLLPLIEMAELHEAPAEVGKDTVAAMRSGLFWGTIGAAHELIARMSDGAGRSERVGSQFRRPTAGGDVAGGEATKLATAPSTPAPRPQVFLTGGAAASVASLLAQDARYLPDLTLSGIAITAEHLARRE
jgi:type III pantothenate kinase